ncbi:OmpP1/FadL family transporter [Crenobacter sp. SG2305]|uniref:OmpP1/FadL family transporter n=1 Tax=Crenobacter oryzisoli TaxID=3056844 RepID=UPI0025AB4203|nr:OmpP1/FadL family transporter [Crenobacter sp. SG2305]MDN0082899.1 OmpP1/FadL family transporter [Crenobacter sp. SG2305]
MQFGFKAKSNDTEREGITMKMKHLSLAVMLMGGAVGVLSTQALASGYQFGSQSVSGQGNAHANGAEANDPTTIFSNPAGMSRLDGTQISGGLSVVVPHSDYTDNGSTNILHQSTGGGNGGTFAPSAVAVPSLYMTNKVNDKINVGLGVFVPYAAKLDYGFDWAGRYALKDIELASVNINPSISFKFDEHHSVGFGVSAQYMDATLEQMADATSGLALTRAKALGGVTPANIQRASAELAALGVHGDGLGHVEGTDWGFGWNVGYMFQLDENTRFGLAYRSSVKQTLTGSSTWTFNNVTGSIPGAALGLPVASVSAATLAKSIHPNAPDSIDVTTPETASANFFHQINPRWAVMGDVTWVRNSRLNEIRIKQDTVGGVSQGDLVIPTDWKDTYRVSVGGDYKYSDSWLFRAGLAWEQSPIRSDESRHPALPDSDRIWLSLGANYAINKNSSIDFAYSFIDFKNANINYSDSCSPVGVSPSTGQSCTGNGGTVKGSYKTYLQLVGLQYNYRF